MKIVKIKQRDLEKRKKVSLRSLGSRLDRAAAMFKSLQEAPEFQGALKVRLYNGGLVMRIDDQQLKTRVFSRLNLKSDVPLDATKSAYLYSVGELYIAENTDTRQALVTAEQKVSDRAKAFYSRLDHPKYRKTHSASTLGSYKVPDASISILRHTAEHKSKVKR